jgi:hypothetical protein
MTTRTHITILTIAVAVTAFLIGIATQANAQSWCPEGHQLVVDRDGPYYVYTPNLPAGYSAVWVNDHVTLIPPPGTYGQTGNRVRVCYTEDIHAYATQIGRLPQTPTPDLSCTVDGEHGIRGATGECWTASLYDQVFSAENLATVPHQADPTRSVADVYGLTTQADLELAPSLRPRVFTYPGGVTVYATFADTIRKANAI